MNPSINSYRFFAFLAVFLFHIDWLPCGYLGVQAFFVLSGFLITPILLKTKANTNGFLPYLKNFLTRRFLRIFPLYYMYLLGLTALVSYFALGEHPYFSALEEQLFYAFTYTYNLYHQSALYEHNKFLTHFWSLAVEEQFYLIWPLLIYFLSKRKLIWALIAICLATPGIRFLTAIIVENQYFDILLTQKDIVVYVSTTSQMDAFAIGSLLGMLPRLKINTTYIFSSILLVALLGLGHQYYLDQQLNFDTLGYPPFMSGGYNYVWGYTVVNICFGLILVGLRSQTFLPLLFQSRQLSYLGLISYGLYIYHYGIIWAVDYLANQGYLYGATSFKYLIALGLTIGISAISYQVLEKPFIKLKDKIAPKGKKNRQQPTLSKVMNKKAYV